MYEDGVFSAAIFLYPGLFNGVLIQVNYVSSSKSCSKWQLIMLAGI